ncbi:hypothetical protein L596_010680 [Steinernema carpocapsae]|uniref:Uncharacterized protein n=1 Tax=Steinernema carpocapsae TaxID=34508 RepID=A0A4U5PJ06_STECR|nr:hypothetical protein L596_010680 [Steinernema carpocapsae]
MQGSLYLFFLLCGLVLCLPNSTFKFENDPQEALNACLWQHTDKFRRTAWTVDIDNQEEVIKVVTTHEDAKKIEKLINALEHQKDTILKGLNEIQRSAAKIIEQHDNLAIIVVILGIALLFVTFCLCFCLCCRRKN